MTEKTIHYSQDYDKAFDQLPHYKAYPRMRPFVGSQYGRFGDKVLMVAESHYLPAGSTVHMDAERWYAGSEADLASEREPRWIHTRGILNKSAGRWRSKGHTIYRRLEQALVEAGFPESDNTFKYVAFMNGFQRPAVEGLSLKPHKADLRVSRDTLNGVVAVLQPDQVIFVSSKARRFLGGQLTVASHGVPHPACAWWYRASKCGTGKERFINLVSGLYSETETGHP